MDLTRITAKAQMLVHAPAVEVFEAFAKPEMMSRFWFARRDEGLVAGDTVQWFLGEKPEAPKINVKVKVSESPHKLIVDWGHQDEFTTVSWILEEKGNNLTLLKIEESGFSGSEKEIIERVLDSTAGFNQVLLAAKALVEHGVSINVVQDHA